MDKKDTCTRMAREIKGKTSFIIEHKDLETIAKFTYEQKGKVLTYISDFVIQDVEPDITTVEGMAANFFIQTIEKYNEKYLEICRKNAENRKRRNGKEMESKGSQNGLIPREEVPNLGEEPEDDELPFR